MTTHEQNYDETLAAAREVLGTMLFRRAGWPEGEREKALDDALNNTWHEGLTVVEWANAACDLLMGEG